MHKTNFDFDQIVEESVTDEALEAAAGLIPEGTVYSMAKPTFPPPFPQETC